MKTIKELRSIVSEAMSKEEPTDIITILRENLDSIWPLCDIALDKDLQPKAWDGETKLKVIAWCGFEDPTDPDNDDKEIPATADWEPDYAMFQYYYQNGDQLDDIMEVIATILLSDCSNCCNALEYLTINKYGILSYGNVGSTYHS